MIIKDYIKEYSNLVTFVPNKTTQIHRWYPLVEGFSSDLVVEIVNEQSSLPKLCLDPFGGVGTTALTCQSLGIKCMSIEASPFFYDVAQAKLTAKTFSAEELSKLTAKIKIALANKKKNAKHPELQSKTFFQQSEKSKWIFDKTVSNGIFDIVEEIDSLCVNILGKYKPLLKLSLATILPEVSNVFRNGKCLSYKKNWKDKKNSRKGVHSLFINHIEEVILTDLRNKKFSEIVDNSNGSLIKGDSRLVIKSRNEKFDLVITSPPYLNSRDYTDIYRLELWMLGYVNDYNSERILRKNALTSHVQIQLPKVEFPQVDELIKAVEYLEKEDTELWNKNIPNMVRGYFNDIQNLLIDLKDKLTENAKLYINVSNSSYANYIIEVDTIIAKAAELIGYECEEIRIARKIKTSSQQNNNINTEKMRESIIVLKLKNIHNELSTKSLQNLN